MAKKVTPRVKNAIRSSGEEVEESKSKKKTKSKSKKSSKSFKLPSFKLGFLADPRTKRVSGLFLLVFSFYLFLAMTSYLITWFSWSTDDIFSDLSLGRVLSDQTIEVQNWTGRLGAALSQLLIKQWFGIASYLILLNFFLIGFKWLTNIKCGQFLNH